MSRFSGRQGKGAMRTHRELKRDEAGTRATEFEADYNAKGGTMTRKEFAHARYVERLANPKVTVTVADN